MKTLLRSAALLTACFFLASCSATHPGGASGTSPFSNGALNVRAFGARGDGKNIDSGAINQAIVAANAAGGGTVYLPAGTYLSYSIRLKSNVSLYLDQGATILAAPPKAAGDETGYDAPEEWEGQQFQDFGHTHWHNSLIWGEEVENVSILGPGRIDGKGLHIGGHMKGNEEETTANLPTSNRFGFPYHSDSLRSGIANKAIALKLCKNVIIRDVTIFRGGHFGILATGVDNLTCDNLKIDTNRDGIDIDCCRGVRVSNCTVNSPADDGICPKASLALGYPRPTENVTISDCQVSGYVMGSVIDGTFKKGTVGGTGRIKLGTEANGGFKNITITNCVFDYCRGLALEEVDGGTLEGVTISNITMRDISNAPIFIRLGSRLRGPDGGPPSILRHIRISNIVCLRADRRYGSIISGIPEGLIEDVSIDHVSIQYAGGGTAKLATSRPAENEAKYPEPSMFGDLPAYGFYVRHVKGLNMSDIELTYLTEEHRPAFIFEDVSMLNIRDVRAEQGENAPIMLLRDVSGFDSQNVKGLKNMSLEKVEEEGYPGKS